MAIGAAILLGSTVHAEEPARGGTLVTALTQTPRHLNPALQAGIATGAPGAQLFAAPLRYDEDWTPQPYLAESWDWADDGLSITLRLVRGATFHDGQLITSADVAFSVDAIKANHPFKTMFGVVTGVDTPDPHTAILRLSQPHPALLLAMSSQLMPIIPKHIYGDGQDLRTHPRNARDVVGSGPFKLVEFTPDQHVILERHEGFFIANRPYLDRIVYRIIKDPSVTAIGVENGELDMVTYVIAVRDIKRMSENDDLSVSSKGYAAIGPIEWLAFNTGSDGPLSDPRVRQAIAYSIDKRFILDGLMQGFGQEAHTALHPGSPLSISDVNTYDLDLDTANRLLDEAGYPKGDDGVRFSLSVDYGNPTAKPQAEYTKAALAKVGINVRVNPFVDFPSWAQRIANHDFDMTWDTVFNWGDPVIGVHRTYDSRNIQKGVIWSNTQQYANPRIDALMDEAGRELDPSKRAALYREFQQILAEDLPVYWTNTLPFHTVYNKKVGNPPLGIWGASAPYDRVYLKN